MIDERNFCRPSSSQWRSDNPDSPRSSRLLHITCFRHIFQVCMNYMICLCKLLFYMIKYQLLAYIPPCLTASKIYNLVLSFPPSPPLLESQSIVFYIFLVKGVRLDSGVWLIPWPRSSPCSPCPLWTCLGGAHWQPCLSPFPCFVHLLCLNLIIINTNIVVVRFIANSVCSKTMRSTLDL